MDWATYIKMARLSDFVWNTGNPPRSVTRNQNSGIVVHQIPGRRGDILQDMGYRNQNIGVSGKLFDQSGSTREEQRDDIMQLYVDNNPMTLTVDVDSDFGIDGDGFTELTIGWTDTNCTVATDSSVEKVGTNCLKITGLGGSDEILTSPTWTSLSAEVPHYSTICFWLRVAATTAANDITVRVMTSAGNYFAQDIDVSTYRGGFTANVWKEVILALGTPADDDWSETGSPSWQTITQMALAWDGAASDTVYIDGLAITNAVLFNSMPEFTDPPGRPNQYDYRFDFKQYIQ